MSGYLASVALRVLAPPNLVRPRVASPFEPGPPDALLADRPVFGSAEPADEPPRHRAPALPSSQHAETAAESSPQQTNVALAHASTTEADTTPRPARTRGRATAEPHADHARRERTPAENPPVQPAKRAPGRPVAPTARALVGSEERVGSDGLVGSEERAAERPTAPPVVRARAATPIRRSSLPAAVAATLPASIAGRRAQPPPATAAADAPIVRVSIGRIEVRATPVLPPSSPPRPPSQPTHVSLAEYLRRRDAGER